ncbi:protoporphyrinogen/coproporphyrinogen oxidase [Streptomyces sp. NPDC054796]
MADNEIASPSRPPLPGTREQPGQQGEVAVVGSGAAGLAAAFRLRQAGYRVRLFEQGDRLGGRMRTLHRDGFLIEEGATQLARGYGSFMGIARDAGLGGEFVPASSLLGMLDRFGTTHNFAVEHLPRDVTRTGLISPRNKLALARIAYDLMRYRKQRDVEDLSRLAGIDHLSAEQYGRQRVGDEVFDHFIDPVVRGFVGTAPSEISAACMLYAFGLFMRPQPFLALRQGMSSYADLLCRRFEVTLGARVTCVERHRDEVKVVWRDVETSEHTASYQGAVIATLPEQAARIHKGLGSWRKEFLAAKVGNATITALHVAMDRVPGTTASMVYATEHSHHSAVLAASLEHNKVPHRIPAGKALVTLYASSAWSRQLIDQDDGLITRKLIEAGSALVPAVGDHTLFTHVTRWPYSWMQSYPGYWTAMREFQARSRREDSLVRLAGDYFCTSSVNAASASGERAARNLIAAMRGDRST